MIKLFLFICIIPVLFSISSCKKDETTYGRLTGSVKNEFNQVIDGAIVTARGYKTSTSVSGVYNLDELPVGSYTVSVSKELYIDDIQEVNIRDGEETVLDFKLKAGKVSLLVSDSLLNFPSVVGHSDIEIVSNSAWLIEHSSKWIKCSTYSGNGNAKIRITHQANTESAERSDTLFIKTGSINKKIIIKQSLHFHIVSAIGLIGNGEVEVYDSVRLIFNKPVTIKQIVSNYEFCICDLGYTMINNNQGVMFRYSCAELGGEYPFTIKIEDEDGSVITENVNIAFYESVAEFNGIITHYMLTPDEKKCWVTTREPNKLYCISTEDMKVLSCYDLPYDPLTFTINPYNQLLYISSADPSEYYFDNRIYVHNPNDGNLVKIITIEQAPPSTSTDKLFPWSLKFTGSGYGLLILTSGGYYVDWRIIDSADGDTVYRHPDQFSSYFNSIHLENVYANHDLTKLIMNHAYGDRDITLFDVANQEFSEFRPVPFTRMVFIAVSRKDEKVFFGQIYDQYIVDMDNESESKMSYLDNRFGPSADFAYSDEENLKLYYCDENYLQLLDYKDGVTLMWCETIYNLKNFTVAIDGKSAFANNTYSLFKFNTAYFNRHLNHSKKAGSVFRKK